MKKKIIIFVPDPLFPVTTGSQVRMLQIARFAIDLGWDVHVVGLFHRRLKKYAWPEDSGTRCTALGLTLHLHEVSFLSLDFVLTTAAWVWQKKILRRPWIPAGSMYYKRRGLTRYIAELSIKIDAAVLLVNYVYWYEVASDVSCRTVLDSIDVATDYGLELFRATNRPVPAGWNREALLFEEISKMKSFDSVIAISPKDHNELQARLGEAVVYVPFSMEHDAITTFTERYILGVIGAWNDFNLAGLKLLDEVFQKTAQPAISVAVAGGLSRYETATSFARLGYVDDIRTFYTSCRIMFVSNIGGSGVKTKLIEAMSLGCAVLCHQSVVAELPEAKHFAWVYQGLEDLGEIIKVISSLPDAELSKRRAVSREMFDKHLSQSIARERLETALTGGTK